MTGLTVWQKDFGIMPCSYLTRHPSGLIPIPFGLSVSRPFRLLSFSFFPFSVFFWENIFFIGNAGMLARLLTCAYSCRLDCATVCWLERRNAHLHTCLHGYMKTCITECWNA